MRSKTDVHPQLDELDRRIVRELLADARLSYRQIASRTNVSVATIMHRMNRLLSSGLVKGTTCILDYHLLGYELEAMIQLRISKGKLFEVEKKIASHANVYAVYDVTGDYDAIIFARFSARRQLDDFLKKIQTYDFVERTHTSFILNTIKEKQALL
ncbi:Lrp/AsnC family transcriptional regulator [Candidatus Woesearchaeota archaeon]|nr:Lrp/AsnC family transcriptional regulator [Candidatus Woesearchaeota archaeon]